LQIRSIDMDVCDRLEFDLCLLGISEGLGKVYKFPWDYNIM